MNVCIDRRIFALGALGLASVALAGEKPAGLVKSAEIALAGDEEFDQLAVDGAGKRVYVAHGSRIDVIDVETHERVGSVENVDGARGVLILPDAKRGFATSSKRSKAIAFSLDPLAPTKEVATGEGCAGLLAVSKGQEVWTLDHEGRTVTCIDPQSVTVKVTIPLEGKPSAAVEDPANERVFVALEDKGSVSVIDVRKHAVVGTHSLNPGQEPRGLAFDEKTGLLFAGCDRKLVALDVKAWRVVATPEIGEDCHGVAFDHEKRVVFASCAKGGTAALFAKDAKSIEPMVPLADARSCAWSSKTNELYLLAAPKDGEKKGPIRLLVYGTPR